MKTQLVWACITRAGVIARKEGFKSQLLAADSSIDLEFILNSLVSTYRYRGDFRFFDGRDYLKRKRLRIARVVLIIKEEADHEQD